MLMRGAWGFSVFAVLAIFLDRFSVFVPKKFGFFGFGIHCGLRIFRILAFGFREKYDSIFRFLTYLGSCFSSI